MSFSAGDHSSAKETTFCVLPAHKAFFLPLLLRHFTMTIPLVCFYTASPSLSILLYVCASTMTCNFWNTIGISAQALHTQSAEQIYRDIYQAKNNPIAVTDDSVTKVYLWKQVFTLCIYLCEYTMRGEMGKQCFIFKQRRSTGYKQKE